MIYRDDDISKYTDLTTLFSIQNLFDKYKKVHTVTLIMEGLWDSRGVWEWLMTTSNIDIGLHGWRHEDYSKHTWQSAKANLQMALEYWYRNTERMGYKKLIRVFYPPWNATGLGLNMACRDLDLIINDSVDRFHVYNFHWWEHIGGKNLNKLEEVLKK